MGGRLICLANPSILSTSPQEVLLDEVVCSMTIKSHGCGICRVMLALELGSIVLHLHFTKIVEQGLVCFAWDNFQEVFQWFVPLRTILRTVVHIKVAILHELHEVWLECLLPFLALLTFMGLLLSRHSFIVFVVGNAEAIEEEHPLIDLELVYVQLAHQFYNFDRLFLYILAYLLRISIENSDQLC